MTDKKIKILHLFYIGGGIATSVNLITQNTNSDIFQHVVISGISKDDSNEELHNSKIYNLNLDRNINFIHDLQLISQVLRICKKENPNLIHAHSAKGGLIGKVVAFLTSKKCLHTPQAYSFLSTDNIIKRYVYLYIEKLLKVLPHKILASSKSESKRAIIELNYDKNRVITFSNCIKPVMEIKELSIEKKWPDGYICTVGRPSYQKNIELMLDIVYQLKKNLPSVHLVIMGVGYYSPNLQAVNNKIDRLGLKSDITLLNWTSREEIFSIIRNSQLYISTARYEGLPYSVIEALALSKAVVLSDTDGNRDLVEHGKNGFLIFEQNIEDFKQKIIELLNNKDKRLSFEEHSKKIFEEHFNIDKTIKKLETIYTNESL